MPPDTAFVEGRERAVFLPKRKSEHAAPATDSKGIYLLSARQVPQRESPKHWPLSLGRSRWKIRRTGKVLELSEHDQDTRAVVDFFSPAQQRLVISLISELDQRTSAEIPVSFWKQLAHMMEGARAAIPASRREIVRESFILRAHRLDSCGYTDDALDLIYDAIDELMRSDKFSQLDSIISEVPVAHLSADVLLGILTATLPARSRLASRAELFHSIEEMLKIRSEYETGLLAGLE